MKMDKWPPIEPGKRFLLLAEIIRWDCKEVKIAEDFETLAEVSVFVKEIKGKVKKGCFGHKDAKFTLLKYAAEEVSIPEITPEEKLFK